MISFFKKHVVDERVHAYALIVMGCVIGGAAYPLFLVPNNIAPGGVTGVATIFNYLWSWPVGITSMVLNLPLFLIGYKSMGGIFAFRSLVATVLFSLFIDLLQLPPLTDDPLLASVYGALVLGLGLGLIMRGGATTGGSDMVARMVHKRFPIVSVGIFLFLIDCAVILCAAFTMSADAALYALICIFVSARVIDLVLAGLGSAKACFIISKRSQAISQRIMEEMDRGCTLLSATGAYSGEQRTVVLSVVSMSEVIPLKRIVKQEDAKAFVFITDTHETLGEGFGKLEGE